MWYCGSICAAFMWRYMIPSLTPPSGRFMTCQKYTQKRLILLTYFWAIEAFLGILALRSLNYVNEEARDKVTPKSALIKMQVFSLLRNAFKNLYLWILKVVVPSQDSSERPWMLTRSPKVEELCELNIECKKGRWSKCIFSCDINTMGAWTKISFLFWNIIYLHCLIWEIFLLLLSYWSFFYHSFYVQ